jgi:hypothetical protein
MKKILIFSIILLAIYSANAQGVDIKDGVGIGSVKVGASTRKDVESKFGKPEELIKHKKYSTQMLYKEKGLSFYFCQSDKKQQIFVIEIRRPFQGKTLRGVQIGTSTREDVKKLYGDGNKKNKAREYRGIQFYYTPTKKDGDIVTEIDIYEKTGIRQCKVSK